MADLFGIGGIRLFGEGKGIAPIFFVVIIVGVVIAGIAVYAVTQQSVTPSAPENLRVHFINVGQGDSIYIKTPTGKDVLIDGGEQAAGSKVVSYLRSQGVDDIELMIATHPDADHIGGLINVLNSFSVEQVWDSGYSRDTSIYQQYLAAVNAEGCPIVHPRRGEAIDIDTLLDEYMFNPPATLYSDSNNNSIVLKISFNSVSFIFTGDIDAGVEGDILGQGFSVSSTVLKVAHHGSSYSSTSEFLNSVAPSVSVISVGAGNTYGHPAQETLDGLAAVGSELYRTDLNGNIVVETDGTTYNVSVQK